MHGIWAYKSQNITINNLGIMKAALGSYFTSNSGVAHFVFEASEGHLTIENFVIPISESQSEFNAFTGYNDKASNKNSHFVIWGQGNNFASFKDSNSKIILDLDKGFEFGKEYLISKLVTDKSGNSLSMLNVEFSRLTTRSDLFYLTQNGENFIAHLADSKTAGYSATGSLYKANIRTMNNFWTMSNSMIYPKKYHKSQNLRKSSLRADSQNLRGNPLALSSLRVSEASVAIQDLNANETFFYQNESQNPQTRRIKRPNKRNYSRNLKDSSLRADSQNLRGNPPYENNVDSALSLKSYESFSYRNESQNRRIQRQKRSYNRNSQNLNTDSANRTNKSQNQRFSQNLAQNPQDYYFILTPFINHNYFFESGRYNLSGFDYGFLTAFSGKIAESNSLGAHFAFSYGSLNDKHDKDLSIRAMNFMLGLHYKLDLVYDMHFKARGDFFYFLNQVKTLTMMEAIKPNNLGFGLSVSYGKDFDFKQGGVLGIEAGLDYKALKSNTIELHDNTYQKQLYHLLYLDLGISYAKYFGGFGINANLGIKGNITANKLAKSQINLKNFNRSVDMILDNDKILGYANVGLSYVLNHRNFDMEFSLAYYGNFGDRIISNGGGFEWRVGW